MIMIKRAMILAAGYGARLGALTQNQPKALVETGGRPLIDYALERLEAAGVEHIVVNAHYHADQLVRYLARRAPAAIILREPSLLDTGGALKAALPLMQNAPFYLAVCDGLLPQSGGAVLPQLAAGFAGKMMDARLLTVPRRYALAHRGGGDFAIANGLLSQTTTQAGERNLVYTGWAVVSAALLARAPQNAGAFPLPPCFFAAAKARRLGGMVLAAPFIDAGTPAGLQQVSSFLPIPALAQKG